MPIAAIPAIGGIISGAGSLVGGLIGSHSANAAGKRLGAAGQTAANNINATANTAATNLQPITANAQTGVTNAATGAQGSVAPYVQAGNQGVTSLASALAPGGSVSTALNTPFQFNPGDLTKTPGYQFDLQQGSQAIKNNAASTGLINSGATLKSLDSFATGTADRYYQQAYNNAMQTYQTNRQNPLYMLSALQNLSGQGQQASEYSGTAGLQGAQIAGNYGLQSGIQQGNWQVGGQEAAMQAYMQGQGGQASGTVGAGNAWQGALGGITNSVNQGIAMNNIPNSGYIYNPPGTFSGTGQQVDNSGNYYNPSNPNNFIYP